MNKLKIQKLAGLLNEIRFDSATIIKNGQDTRVSIPKNYVIICHTSTSKLKNGETKGSDAFGKFNAGYYLKKSNDWNNLQEYPYLTTLRGTENLVTRNFEEAHIFSSRHNYIWESEYMYYDNRETFQLGEFFEPLLVEVDKKTEFKIRLKKTGESYTATNLNKS